MVASLRDGAGLGGLGGGEEEEDDTSRQGDVGGSRVMFDTDWASDIVPSKDAISDPVTTAVPGPDVSLLPVPEVGGAGGPQVGGPRNSATAELAGAIDSYPNR